MRVGVILIIAYAAILQLPISAQTSCTFHPVICEWKYHTFHWACENDLIPYARAFWGREPGDRTTCSDGVPKIYLQNDDCRGNSTKASLAVTQWCNKNVRKDGKCRIRASKGNIRIDGEKYDPCKGTFKYLKVCRYCVAQVSNPWTTPPQTTSGPPVTPCYAHDGTCRTDCQGGEHAHSWLFCPHSLVCCVENYPIAPPSPPLPCAGTCRTKCILDEEVQHDYALCNQTEICCITQPSCAGTCRRMCNLDEYTMYGHGLCDQTKKCCVERPPCQGTCRDRCILYREDVWGFIHCKGPQKCCVPHFDRTCEQGGRCRNRQCKSGEYHHNISHICISEYAEVCCVSLRKDVPCEQGGMCRRYCRSGEHKNTISNCHEPEVCCVKETPPCGGTCRDRCIYSEDEKTVGYCKGQQKCCIPHVDVPCERSGMCRGYCRSGEHKHTLSSICHEPEVCCVKDRTCEQGGRCRLWGCQPSEYHIYVTFVCVYTEVCCVSNLPIPCEQGGRCRRYCRSGEQKHSTSICHEPNICCVKGPLCDGDHAVCREVCTSDEHPHTWNYSDCPHPTVCCIDNLFSYLGERCGMNGMGHCERQCLTDNRIYSTTGCHKDLICCLHYTIDPRSYCTSNSGENSTCKLACSEVEITMSFDACHSPYKCCIKRIW